jgi:hypothetical protein
MYRHASTCLKGPVSRSRAWWQDCPGPAQGRTRRKAAQEQPAAGVREELVARVRQEIAAGTYETPEKWERALDRLADRLGRR